MQVAKAQLAARSDEDRIATTHDSVVVLDGASSFIADGPAAGAYVDALSAELVRRLNGPRRHLRSVLAGAIAATAQHLNLQPGLSPSSTVAILRVNSHTIDALVLGDSIVVIGSLDDSYKVLVDERLTELNLPESERYRSRLKAGTGYDDEHRAILSQLQHAERIHRNQPGGYWIAEADPAAANHAMIAQFPRQSVSWAALATDGAAESLVPLGISWPQIAHMSENELSNALARCHQWETVSDPDGQHHPRAKRHDDKTLVVVRLPEARGHFAPTSAPGPSVGKT